MQSISGFWPFFVGVSSVLGAGIYLSFLSYVFRPRGKTARELMREAEGEVAFLFDGPDLVDATALAKRMLPESNAAGTDKEGFIRLFSATFPQLRVAFASLSADGKKKLVAPKDASMSLEMERWNDLTRISLIDASDMSERSTSDRLVLASLEREVSTLRAISEDAPMLIWKEDPIGQVVWANGAYLEAVDERAANPSGTIPSWPPRNLFGPAELPGTGEGRSTRRIRLEGTGGQDPVWYEISGTRRGAEVVCFAVNVSAVVRAEASQRAYVDTLTKTFAQLSVGLAIFAKDRRLLSFNPALVDLTGLPVEFLSGRPQFRTFLDRMRDAQTIPEPKDYLAWRDTLASLEPGAEHLESWNLPNGQTYRVAARPYPNGAIALLIEDVTNDISLNRRFRAELELAHAALDAVRDAAVIISPKGTIIHANAAYGALWNTRPEAGLSESTMLTEGKTWEAACAPTPTWAMIRDFVRGHGGREPWEEPVSMLNGRQLVCRTAPLPSGYSLISFIPAPEAANPLALFVRSRQLPIAAQ